MKDQNLNALIPDERDEDLLVEYGMMKRYIFFYISIFTS